GIRLTRKGSTERDIYVMNGYAPLNEVSHAKTGVVHHEKAAQHRQLQSQFWDTCHAALRQIPQRVTLLLTLDANAAMSPSLPYVGFAGQRRQFAATSANGSRLLEVLEDFHMTALNTFGKSTRQNGTWKHTTGKGWTTIEYVCTRLNGSYGIRAAPLRTILVSMGGYRDHRPVETLVYAGLRAKRAADPRPDRWNREAMVSDLQDLKGRWQEECGEMLCYATPPEYFNAIEHTVIEAAAPDYVLQPTQTQRPELTDATLALIANKHAIQKRMAYCSDPSSPRAVYLQALHDEAAKRAAKAVRAERRQRLASTAAEAEAADANMNLRELHSVTRRLAPKPAAPVITVTSPTTGGACMGAEEEIVVRGEVFCNIFGGTQINMDSPGGPIGIPPRDDARIGTYTVDDVTRAIAKMPNYKSAPVLKLPSLVTTGDLTATGTKPTFEADGSVIELWKLCAAETAPVLHGAFQACQALGHAAQRFKDVETVSLRKPKGDGKNAKDHYRTINLINHIGKVYMNVTAMPPLRNLASKLSYAQFGALAGRSTRDAIAIVAEVIRRYRLHGRAPRLGSTTVPGMLMAVMIDLEKAFDLIDRDDIWQALEALAARREVRLTVEELHEGTCYIARGIRTNRPARKLLIPRGVRQGSVEGPILFVAVYDPLTRRLGQSRHDFEFPEITVIFDPSLRNLRHSHGLSGGEGEEALKVSPVKFVDDLIALTIVEAFDAVSRFLEFLKAEITKGKMKGVLRPALPDLQQKEQPEDSVQDPEDPEAQRDPAKLIRAVVFGRFNFEGPKHKEINSLPGVLQKDLRTLNQYPLALGSAGPKGLDNHLFSVHGKYANPADLAEDQLRALKCPHCLIKFSRKDTLRGPNHQDLPLPPRGKSRTPMWGLKSAKQWKKPKIDLALPEDTAELDANDKLQTLRCRLKLLHEAAQQLLARDDNFTLAVAEGSEQEKTLEHSYQTTVTTPARGIPHGLQYVTTLWMIVLHKAEELQIVEDPAPHDQVEQPAKVPVSTQIDTIVTKVVRSHQKVSLDMVADALNNFMGTPAASLADGTSYRIENNQVRWIWAPTIHIDLKYALTAARVHEDTPELSIQQLLPLKQDDELAGPLAAEATTKKPKTE
ncbi:unnamed protein product, partial [Prorocentrum cordatum]